MKLNKMREDMIKSFVDCLKKDTIPWHKAWSEVRRPFNATTDAGYRGVNLFWLTFRQYESGYKDPRWCTFKQAQSKGWKIKPGEKGTRIEFWSMYDTEEKRKLTIREANKLSEELTVEEFKDRVRMLSSTYTVFNGEQIEGIPAYVEKTYQLNTEELLLRKDTLIKNMGVGFTEDGGRAYYIKQQDKINMPEMNRFESEYDYMATLLHEAGHATGHESRLNREMEGTFGSPEYAREELRAEIASAFTAQVIGIDYKQNQYMENHEAYIQNWISVLENEPNELFAAIKEAEKISDYLIEKGEFEKITGELAISETDKQVKNLEGVHRTWLEERMQKKDPIVINAYGGPGSGKSVACLDICSALKKAGYTAEYVQEYAKELVYENNMDMLNGTAANQFEILKEQLHRVDRLYDQVDFIVTDSPVMLNTIYNRELTPEYEFWVNQISEGYLNYSFFIERDASAFETEGRIHNLEESIEKDAEIKKMLDKNEIKYKSFERNNTAEIVEDAIKTFNEFNHVAVKKNKEKDGIKLEFKNGKGVYERKTDDVLFSGADAARFRLALKGQKKSIDRIINDENMPSQLKSDVMTVGKIAMESVNNGMKIEDIVTSSVAGIDNETGINNTAYTKKLLCNLYSTTRDEYEALKNLPDLWNRENLVNISENLGKKLINQQVSVVVTDSKGLIKELSTPKQLDGNKDNQFFVDTNQFMRAMEQCKDIAPVVKCEWSEAEVFDSGKYYTVKEYDDLMRTTDHEFCATRERIKAEYDTEEDFYNTTNSEEYRYTGYEKNKYTLDFGDGRTVTERQDIGDDEGGIMEHFKNVPSLNVYVSEMDNAIEKDAEFDRYQDMIREVYRYEQENNIPEDFRTTSEEMEVISREMLVKQHDLISRTQPKENVAAVEKNMDMRRTKFRGLEM